MISKKVIVIAAVVLAILAVLAISTQAEATPSEWETDGAILMQIPETGDFICVGCRSDGLCADPAQGWEIVEETEELHCNSELKLIDTRT